MVKLAADQGAKRIRVHAILDGRDMLPREALESINKFTGFLSNYPSASIASVVGRYFAMDRDNRWDRVQQAFDLFVHGQSKFSANSAAEAIQSAYSRNENDEFVSPQQHCLR